MRFTLPKSDPFIRYQQDSTGCGLVTYFHGTFSVETLVAKARKDKLVLGLATEALTALRHQ
jgi:hypothetical protein